MRLLISIIIALIDFYPIVGKVIECNNEVSVIETADGNLWECLDDLHTGQNVIMLMYDNGTPVVDDDIIIHIWRNHNG